ncbi:MAG: methyltransferase domain-containing protein [Blastocatellia bacterium]
MTQTIKNEWWKPFYDETFVNLLTLWKDQAEIDLTVDFLIKELDLKPGMTVFDQCCGVGSLSLPLAERGINVIGVDLSHDFINKAKSQANENSHFYCADAFDFIPSQACSGAFNWHTSFGYSESDKENVLMLKNAFAALKPGGKFVLDYPNMACVLKNFENTIVRHIDSEEGEILLVRESQINLSTGMLQQLWTISLPTGKQLKKPSFVKIYLPHSIVDMLKECGFYRVEIYSNTLGENQDLNSPRCIYKATKPQ